MKWFIFVTMGTGLLQHGDKSYATLKECADAAGIIISEAVEIRVEGGKVGTYKVPLIGPHVYCLPKPEGTAP